MNKMYKIVIDTKGADSGVGMVVRGAVEAIRKFDDLSILLVGDENELHTECKQYEFSSHRIEILNAQSEITNYDDPTAVIFAKADSSMAVAMRALAERDDICGMISAGNTGAVLSGSLRYLSGKNRVRPALAAILPAENGSFTCLVDTGATIDCTPATLLHFARLGSDFMKKMYCIEAPRIGLLSNGAEPTKGNKLVKETHTLLKDQEDLNFIGNVEGNVALSGMCDVLVCDGFAGNQVLKVSEGMAKRIITDIVKYAKRTENPEIMKLAEHLMGVYDLSSLGGGIVLGIEKPIIKARGSSNEKSIVSISGMLLNLSKNEAIFDKEKVKI